MDNESVTFAGFPRCEDISRVPSGAAILGIPYGIPYQPGALSPSHSAPEAIRRQSMRYPEDVYSWDFDLGGTLLDGSALQVVDCGNLPGDPLDPDGNLRRGIAAVRSILGAGAIPVILGGDDSIPNMVFPAYEGLRPLNILQIDAHIDWRHEVGGVTQGFSSPMRRASELEWVNRIIQAGARGTGTARREEYEAAQAYGARIIPAQEIHRAGIEIVLEHVPPGEPCFITIDCDGLDPAVMPGVWSPSPGGLTYHQVIGLLRGIRRKARLAGLCLVEYVPERDVNCMGEISAMRIVWCFIGELARQS